ncbi:MAG: ISAs1 family transposase, partial [Longispora sp.]|nr:ISAs1 family transposase [Longispora sp. (in: high G+C Gram-positive bacteria)]
MTASHVRIDDVSHDAMDTADIAELHELFVQVPDPRDRRGVRHPLAAALTLMVLAVLCGARNFRQAADRVSELPQPLLHSAGARLHPALGICSPPSRDTLRRLVEAIDANAVDLLVCRWLAHRIEDPPEATGLALDGKTVRHSSPEDPAGNIQLFSAMRHDTAIVIAQVQVPSGTTEVTQIATLLDPIDITGMIVTADAAHPSTDTAAYLRGRGADHVFTVKGNKPSLLTSICDRFTITTSSNADHTDTEHHNGKIICRQIWTAPASGIDFPDAHVVFRLRRDTYDLTGVRLSKDVVHGITSRATTASAIADHVRRHWGIENKTHWMTHVKRLKEPEDEVATLLERAKGLGDLLGPFLLQLPPSLRADQDLLAVVLRQFPATMRVAVEFRHESWWTTQTRETLENYGAALVWADRCSKPISPLWRTADWGYLRLHE